MYLSELLTRRRDSCSRPLSDHGSLGSKCVTHELGNVQFVYVHRVFEALSQKPLHYPLLCHYLKLD